MQVVKVVVKVKLSVGGSPYELSFLAQQAVGGAATAAHGKFDVASASLEPWKRIVEWTTAQTARPFQRFAFGVITQDTDKKQVFAKVDDISRFIRLNMGGTQSGAALRRMLLLLMNIAAEEAAFFWRGGGAQDKIDGCILDYTDESGDVAKSVAEVEARSATRQRLHPQNNGAYSKKKKAAKRMADGGGANWWDVNSFGMPDKTEPAEMEHDVLLFGTKSCDEVQQPSADADAAAAAAVDFF